MTNEIKCNYKNIDYFFFSSRRRHTRLVSDWSSDVCSSDLEFALLDYLHEVEHAAGRVERLERALEEAVKSAPPQMRAVRSEEHTSELQSLTNLVCRLLLEKKKKKNERITGRHTKRNVNSAT